MKRALVFLLALTVLVSVVTAYADTWYVYTANGKSLNLRSERDNAVIGNIPYGTRLESDESRSTATMAYVTYGGKTGYVSRDYLVQNQPPALGANGLPVAAAAPVNANVGSTAYLPTDGYGAITIQAIGASIQYGGAGAQYSAVSYDYPREIRVTADQRPEYWVIDGVRYDFEYDIPRYMTINDAWDSMIIEAVPKGGASRTLLSPQEIQSIRTGMPLIVRTIHAKLCHIKKSGYGAGGWYDWFDFTYDYQNLATGEWEQGGQVTIRVRASIPAGKKIQYWKFDETKFKFSTDVTQFVVRTLNVSKVYEPIFDGSFSTVTENRPQVNPPSAPGVTPAPTVYRPVVTVGPTAAPGGRDPNGNPYVTPAGSSPTYFYVTAAPTNNVVMDPGTVYYTTPAPTIHSGVYTTEIPTYSWTIAPSVGYTYPPLEPSVTDAPVTRPPSNPGGTVTRPTVAPGTSVTRPIVTQAPTATPAPATRPSNPGGTVTRPTVAPGNTVTRPSQPTVTATPAPATRPSTTSVPARPSQPNVTATPAPATRPSQPGRR